MLPTAWPVTRVQDIPLLTKARRLGPKQMCQRVCQYPHTRLNYVTKELFSSRGGTNQVLLQFAPSNAQNHAIPRYSKYTLCTPKIATAPSRNSRFARTRSRKPNHVVQRSPITKGNQVNSNLILAHTKPAKGCELGVPVRGLLAHIPCSCNTWIPGMY